jgi:hypothetical protein
MRLNDAHGSVLLIIILSAALSERMLSSVVSAQSAVPSLVLACTDSNDRYNRLDTTYMHYTIKL